VCASTVHADDNSWKAAFSPLPSSLDSAENPVTPSKVALGKKLFNDTRFSQDNTLSCNSCHNLKTYGVDNDSTSVGHKGQRGNRNSPTVYNAALHTAQFWDGRAGTVEQQALGPILNPVEMAMSSETQVLERLKADPATVAEFKEAFPGESDPVTYANVGKAIGAFERTLITPSRFDEYLNGKEDALTADEIKGAKTFLQAGCVACHNGSTIGGQMYQKLGLVKDLGRFEVTKNEADKYFFKVPSLRNIEKTGPYFHDGSVKTLEEAVKIMGEYQLGKNLRDEETKEIVTFLRSLTAPLPAM
jgi:cytochrome c peroxidase